MSKRISDERLRVLHGIVQLQARNNKNNNYKRRDRGQEPQRIMAYVDAEELSCILDELRKRRDPGRKNINVSPWTITLTEMKIGDTVEFPPMTQGALTTLRTTARKRMNNLDARWHAQTRPDGYLDVTRMPDGSEHLFGRPKSPLVDQLASMNIGDKIIIKTTASQVYNALKVQARKKMDRPRAQWKTNTLVNGKVRVERTN